MTRLEHALLDALPQVFGPQPMSAAWWVRPAFAKAFLRAFLGASGVTLDEGAYASRLAAGDLAGLDALLADQLGQDYERTLAATITTIRTRLIGSGSRHV